MYPYVALRGPRYRENSHANHTWDIPIARSTLRCLAYPCVALGRARGHDRVPTVAMRVLGVLLDYGLGCRSGNS